MALRVGSSGTRQETRRRLGVPIWKNSLRDLVNLTKASMLAHSES